MNLPPEIRNQIYKYVVRDWPFRKDPSILHHAIEQPALLRCSTLTRAEGLAIWFRDHHFEVETVFFGAKNCLKPIATWLRGLDDRSRQNIRNFTIGLPWFVKDDLAVITGK